jgi:hypothetical protein
MPRLTSPFANALVVGWTALVPFAAAGHANSQDTDRTALIVALERLIATGQPHHTTHDEGQRLQLGVDAAIARGDHEIERLAIRASSPLTASIDRPVASINEPPSIEFDARTVLRVNRAVPYTARLFASLDGGAYVRVSEVRSGETDGGRINALDLQTAEEPGFHVIELMADLTFGTKGRTPAWIERRMLPPLSYALYDPVKEASAPVQALIYGPASTPVHEFDPKLGADSFAAWLSRLLSKRRGPQDTGPEWLSQYCHERTSEVRSRQKPSAICSVLYFQWQSNIGQIWFRTAEIRETEHGVEWTPTAPAQFEGLVFPGWGVVSQQLSALPSLLNAAPGSRPTGDISISPSDIVVQSSDVEPGVPAEITVTVRNVGVIDLPKVQVNVIWGSDPKVRGVSRTFVVDVAADKSADLTLRATFPTVYGYVMAHAMEMSDHSPYEWWSIDPTPFDACMIRIINEHLAPAGFRMAMTGVTGCSAQ